MSSNRKDKIARAHSIGEGALSMFETAKTELERAAALADEARAEHDALADHHGNQAATALSLARKHRAAADKLGELIGGGE